MEDKRKFKRFPVELSARYLKENTKEWKGCTATNISREGMGMIVYLREKIPLASSLKLEIILPTKNETIKAIGILRWIEEKREGMNFQGGIELTEIDSEDKWTLLDYAYDNWPRKGEE